MERNAEKIRQLDFLSGETLDSAIEVHRVLGGPGLLESVYEEALAYELKLRGHIVESQVAVPIRYKEQSINKPLFLDLLIDNLLIIEVKSVEHFNPVFQAQVLTYLRLIGLPLGLIVNIGEKYIKNGIYRVVNKIPGG
jgi:GxxExxY protein